MPLFELGKVSVSEMAADLLETHHVSAQDLLHKHQYGDDNWSDELKRELRFRAENHLHITIVYNIAEGKDVWIRTADDRTETRIMLPDEFKNEEVDIKEGYARWSQSYDTYNNALIGVEAPIMWAYLSRLNLETVLDAGTGTGRYALKLAEQGAFVVGVDQSMEMMRVAQGKAHRDNHAIGLINARLNAPLPLISHYFDAVICSLVLSHVAELDFVVQEFARMLKPGGHCVISVFHPAGIESGWRTSFSIPGGEVNLPNVQRTRTDYFEAFQKSGISIHEVFDLKVKDVPSGHFSPSFLENNADRDICLIVCGTIPE